MRERFAYLHLPKAAGSAVVEALETAVGAEHVCPWRFDHHLLGTIADWDSIAHPVFRGRPDELRPYRLVVGHFTLPTLVGAFEPADVALILREPRARLVSQYAYWRSLTEADHEPWGDYQAARTAALPLGRFAETARIAHVIDNLALRLVLGPHPLIPVHDFIAEAHVDELVDEAAASIDTLGHVDLLERGPAVFEALSTWVGAPLEVGRRNVTEVDDAAPVDLEDLSGANTVAAVHDRSVADLELWAHVATARGIRPAAARRLADTAATARFLTLATTAATCPPGTGTGPQADPPPAETETGMMGGSGPAQRMRRFLSRR